MLMLLLILLQINNSINMIYFEIHNYYNTLHNYINT